MRAHTHAYLCAHARACVCVARALCMCARVCMLVCVYAYESVCTCVGVHADAHASTCMACDCANGCMFVRVCVYFMFSQQLSSQKKGNIKIAQCANIITNAHTRVFL